MTLKLKADQHGTAHLAIIGVVLLLAVGGAGYYVWSKQKDKTANTSTSAAVVSDAAVEEACNKLHDDKDFCKFASNWAGLENYTTVITSTSPEGTGTITVEAENSEKSRVTTKQGDQEISSFVSIGNTYYTKDLSDGQWTKYTSQTPKETTDVKDDFGFDFTAESDKIHYQKIGTENCSGLNCLKYQIIDPSQPSTEQFVWFDTKDYLLRRFTTKSNEGTSDMTITYGKVSISEPSPIKEAPAVPTGSTDPAELQRQIEAAMQASQASEE